jgi:hypothetical protein
VFADCNKILRTLVFGTCFKYMRSITDCAEVPKYGFNDLLNQIFSNSSKNSILRLLEVSSID